MAAVVNEFLSKCAGKLLSKPHGLTVVLGNEGGDMDSVVGAIYLAMLLDTTEANAFRPAIPAINFPVSELPLRNDAYKLFEELKIDASQLHSVHSQSENFLDMSVLKPQLVLYDHNKLKADQSSHGSLVVGVVDHHFDEKSYVDQTKDLRIIRTCGSACTLVTEMYREAKVPVPCPELLIAPIVLDTVNFEEVQKKVTPEDVEAFQWLCAQGNLGEYNHTQLFKKLSTWKNDIFSLSVEQNLKRDYKFFPFPCESFGRPLNCGIASVPCSFDEFKETYSLPKISHECKAFAQKNSLDTVIIAFAGKKDGVHSRQVAFCATEAPLSIFSDYAGSAPGGVVFSLVGEEDAGDQYSLKAYSLSDPAVSRKRLVPSLSSFLLGERQSAL